MKRSSILAAAVGLAAAVALFGLGCHGGEKKHHKDGPPKALPTKDIDPATTGSVEGAVAFTGSPPANDEISFTDSACKKGLDGPAHFDRVLVANGKLANAFVWVKTGLADYKVPQKKDEVVLDQKNCMYRPLVVGVQIGQPLTFLNSDPILHNVHTLPEENDSINAGMPSAGTKKTITFDSEEPGVVIRTKCDVHPWMRAFIGVVPHPFFQVTGPDGAFKLDGLPPGDYELAAWHETLGTQTVKVTVAPHAAAHADFTFAAK